MKRELILFGSVLIILFIFYWFSLSPTINPQDIKLTGVLKPAKLSPNPKDTDKGYVIEITFDKKTVKHLYIGDNKYFYDIYPIIGEHSNLAWDFFQGSKEDHVKGDKDYSFGNDGRTLNIAATKLKELGIITNDTLQDVNKLSIGHEGFAYVGNKFPQRIRYYLTPIDKVPNQRKSFLIYCHYEKSWGKDLCWAKMIPLEIIEK